MTAKAGGTKGKLQDFYHELEQLLTKQLEAKPDLADVRLKLLELYFEQHRSDDFIKAARSFQRLIPKASNSREWQRIASMGRMLAPGESLFSGHASDTVEFVGSAALLPAEPARIQRFGDEDRYRPLFDALADKYATVRKDARFLAEYELFLVGLPSRRPTPLLHARRLSDHCRGAQIWIKREDFAGDTAHQLVAIAGQALLALRLGRKALVTATSDGRRGLLTATVAARLGLKAVVYVDAEQSQRFAAQTLFMTLMGAEVKPVKTVHYRNRDVREAALAHWAEQPDTTLMVMGLDAAPPPYPVMTQEFVAAVGRETRRQFSGPGKRLPDVLVTRGSLAADALGLFPAFLADTGTRLVCVEPEAPADPDAKSAIDPFTQVGMPMTGAERKAARKILDRLEYPSVAREHALLKASGRVEYVQTLRRQAAQALQDLARLDGIVPGIETAHALAWACEAARGMKGDQAVLVLMAESPDKDAWEIADLVGVRVAEAANRPAPARKPDPPRKP